MPFFVRSIIVVLGFLCIHVNGQATSLNIHYDRQLRGAHQALINHYYATVADGALNNYPDSLIVDFDLSYEVSSRGIALFNLIEWLEQQSDPRCAMILDQLNELYTLEFHRILANKNIVDEKIMKMVGTLNSLIRSQHPMTKKYIFRTILTKTLLSILIIENSKLSRAYKKISLTQALEESKYQLLTEFSKLDVPSQKLLALNEVDIATFIYTLASESAQQPLVQSAWVPYLISFVISSTALALIVLYIPWKDLGYWVRDNVLRPLFEGVSEEHAKSFVKGVFSALQNEKIIQDMQKGLAEVWQQGAAQFEQAVTNIQTRLPNDPQAAANNASNVVNKKVEEIGESLVKGMMRQVPVVGRWYPAPSPQTPPPH